MAVVGQAIVNGVALGSIYALVAAGLALIFGVLGVVNFAHGELYMLGAFAAYFALEAAGAPYGLAVLAATLGLAGLGWCLHRLVVRPLADRPFDRLIVATVGVSIALQNAALWLWGGAPRNVPSPLAGRLLTIGESQISLQRAGTVVVAAAVFAGLHLFLRRSRYGKAIRALAQNPEAALIFGVPVARLAGLTLALGSAMAGLAGAMVAPLYSVFPAMGLGFVFKAFAVVIVGGMGNVYGAVLAGLLLGVAESLAGTYLSATLRDTLAFGLMVAVLLWRPEGLLGRQVRV